MSVLAADAAHDPGRSSPLARVGLTLVAAANLEVGLWGEISPRGFYGNFPAPGHHWVAALGPYNEHLVRDYAAAEIGFAVLLACMTIWFAERRLVLAGGLAFLAANLPHFAYHVTTAGSFKTADNVASLGSFVVEMLVVAAAMRIAWQTPPNTPPVHNDT
jgi:hypothetical protein